LENGAGVDEGGVTISFSVSSFFSLFGLENDTILLEMYILANRVTHEEYHVSFLLIFIALKREIVLSGSMTLIYSQNMSSQTMIFGYNPTGCQKPNDIQRRHAMTSQ
jgi:hypothetical protein